MNPGTQRSFACSIFGAGALLLNCFAITAQSDLNATLLRTATNTNEPLGARIAAIETLIKSGKDAPSVCSNLVDIFLHKSESPELRRAVGLVMRRIPQAENTFVPALMVVLKDRKEALPLRQFAAETYLDAARQTTAFSSDFASILRDPTEDPSLRDAAAKVLEAAARGILARTRPSSDEETDARPETHPISEIISAFQAAGRPMPLFPNRASATRLNQSFWQTAWHFQRWFWFGLLAFPPVASLAIWLLLLWRSPLNLWQVNKFFKALPELRLRSDGFPLGLRGYLLLSFFEYHPRVLDAWLNQHWESLLQQFLRTKTVAERQNHIAVPMRLNNSSLAPPKPEDFIIQCSEPRTFLLVCGRGGIGKTSLACQLARWAADQTLMRPHQSLAAHSSRTAGERLAPHRLLPVWIEEEMISENVVDDSLAAAVISRLQKQLPADEAPAELIIKLLQAKRILVVVDGLSEMTDRTRQRVLASDLRICPLLIVTTRRMETWNAGTPPAVVELSEMQPELLPQFLGKYLELANQRELFDSRELLELCIRFTDLCGPRNLTSLQVRLCLEEACALRSKQAEILSTSIPHLMVRFCERVTRPLLNEFGMTAGEMLRVCAVIAWECLKINLRPVCARMRDVAAALAIDKKTDDLIAALDEIAGLIRIERNGEATVRFSLGAIAEYLAAWRVIDLLETNEAAWREFLTEAAKRDAARISQSFFIAIRECCAVRLQPVRVPDFVNFELGKLAGLDPIELERAQREIRISRLLEQLGAPTGVDRKSAAVQLGELGPAAESALPVLIAKVQTPQDSAMVRAAAVAALGKIDPQGATVVPVLVEMLRERNIRLRPAAMNALMKIGENAAQALSEVARDVNNTEEFRLAAVFTLGASGVKAKSTVSILLQLIRNKDSSLRIRASAAEALGAIGGDACEAAVDLVALMKENKILRRTAAKALIGIAPLLHQSVVVLFEALNHEKTSGPEEELASFRLLTVERGEMNSSRANSASNDVVRAAIDAALNALRSQGLSPHPANNELVALA